MFNVSSIRQDFPILEKEIHGHPLTYLDNSATSQKPIQVIEAISHFYQNSNANVHRGVHQLSDESTQAWENSRRTIAKFFGADPAELIMVRNTTEALNGIAYGWADHNLQEGDVILTTSEEHHSNLVTWQEVAKRKNARLEFIAIDEAGRLDLSDLEEKLKNLPVKLVALVHVSNALGVVQPISEVVTRVKKLKPQARVVLDAAQSAPHMPLNFDHLGVDFMTLSGHKMLGPMGSGVLLVKKKLLQDQEMKPWLFGGGMIAEVQLETSTFHEDSAERFTAGTPDVASAVGLAAACEYLSKIKMSEVEKHDRELVAYALEKLSQVPEVKIVGPVSPPPDSSQVDRLGSVAFLYEGVHAHDVAQILDSQGVAVRSGHHCTMPLHQHFGWPATVRASFQIYNSTSEIETLVSALAEVKKVFS